METNRKYDYVTKRESEQNSDKLTANVEVPEQSTTQNISNGTASLASWTKNRMHQSWNFVGHPETNDTSKKTIGPIGALPPNVQEDLLIRDILFCLSGTESDYITVASRHSDGKIKFSVDETTDSSLLEMTKRLIPICEYYSTVMSFIEEKMHYEYGMVNHAVVTAMQDMLTDYFIVVAELECQHLKSELSLQKLSFYLQPIMSKLNVIASVAQELNAAEGFGGSVLSIVHKRATCLTGDRVCQNICFHLVERAAEPYFSMLEKWIFKGIIYDPYLEFFVVDNEIVVKELNLKEATAIEYSNNYWEKRYTIEKKNIPVFLEKFTDMILRTGKYLNVVRQCGNDVECPCAEPLVYIVGEQQYFEKIQTAYQFASKQLLDLLMDKMDLKGRFRSLKHYFLLDEADFIDQFMDIAGEELSKEINDIIPNRLETLFELSLRTSAINSDKYKDDVKVTLKTESLHSEMTNILSIRSIQPLDTNFTIRENVDGFEAFSLDYDVKWPLSLIVNQKAIALYQFLFRHLFYFRHVETLLARVWTQNKIAKSYPLMVSSSYLSAFALCQKMMTFTQDLDYYFTQEIIEPSWQFFQEGMLKVRNVDEVLLCHQNFLDDCIQGCLIAYPELVHILGKLIIVCIKFAQFMKGTHTNSVEAERMGSSRLMMISSEYVATSQEGAGDSAKSMCPQFTFSQQVTQFENDFDLTICEFLRSISEMSGGVKCAKMVNMVYRLDFNGYYSKKFSKEIAAATSA